MDAVPDGEGQHASHALDPNRGASSSRPCTKVFFRFLRVPCGAWGLLQLPVCCVGAVFPENACQSSCSRA